jgi:pimeloyl-ACP methyl ester carboxylesterase
MGTRKIKDFAVANGTTLSYEKEGAGTAVLFVAGSTGDASNFTRAAELLADEFSVATYDRRGRAFDRVSRRNGAAASVR